jgi:hypothetical protein
MEIGDSALLFVLVTVSHDAVLELITLWCQKANTQETENLDKAISLDEEGASMCSLPLSNMQAQMADSGSSLYP